MRALAKTDTSSREYDAQMILKVNLPVLTTASIAGDEKRKLWLTTVSIDHDIKEQDPDTVPVVAEWQSGTYQYVIRRSLKRGSFLAKSHAVPADGKPVQIGLWSTAYDGIIEAVGVDSADAEDELLHAYTQRLLKPFEVLLKPDLAMIDRQVANHKKDLETYVAIDGAIYEPCEQPYLALVKEDEGYVVEPRFDRFDADHQPIAKFAMVKSDDVRQWLAKNHSCFYGGRNIAAFHCRRPDLLDDHDAHYVSYSLSHRFASGLGQLIYTSTPINLTLLFANLTQHEIDICIAADSIRDGRTTNLLEIGQTASDILAIPEASPLWPAFEQAEFLAGFHKLAAEVLGITPAGLSWRISVDS